MKTRNRFIKPMKNAYVICEDIPFEKVVCAEYIKVHNLNVIRRAYPDSEKQRQAAVRDVMAEAKNGNIDTVVVFGYSDLSRYQDIFENMIVNMAGAGLHVKIASLEIDRMFSEKRQEAELLPLLREAIAYEDWQ